MVISMTSLPVIEYLSHMQTEMSACGYHNWSPFLIYALSQGKSSKTGTTSGARTTYLSEHRSTSQVLYSVIFSFVCVVLCRHNMSWSFWPFVLFLLTIALSVYVQTIYKCSILFMQAHQQFCNTKIWDSNTKIWESLKVYLPPGYNMVRELMNMT